MFARLFIDSREFARNGKELSGVAPVSELPRLHDKLANIDGVVHYTLGGSTEDNRAFLNLTLSGQINVQCQRCLGDYSLPLELSTRFLLLAADDTGEYDTDLDLECIEMEERLDVFALIEDEILLGLPFAAKHPEGVCKLEDGNGQRADTPFAVLANMIVR